ncbi:MAG: hypothetical protein ACRER2_02190 [Methylococcales bacterium]
MQDFSVSVRLSARTRSHGTVPCELFKLSGRCFSLVEYPGGFQDRVKPLRAAIEKPRRQDGGESP